MAVKIERFRTKEVDGIQRTAGADKYIETTYEGAVLETYEVNGYDDSDFFAIVWDEAEAATKAIEYATTRGWTYNNSATVDATDEVRAKAAEFKAATYREQLKGDWAADAAKVRKGSTVRFAKAFNGRKQGSVEKGTEGTVIWTGADRFKQYGERAGVAIEGREEPVWVSTESLEVTDPEPVDEIAIAEEAERVRVRVAEGGTLRSFPSFNTDGTVERLRRVKETA